VDQGETMVRKEIENIVIVGSGPAGCTAALYAARAQLNPVLIEGITPGGQLTITTDVENYPGFAEGIMGPQMMVIFKKQAEKFGARFIQGTVTTIDFSKRPFTIKVDEEKNYQAKVIIIASGATAKLLGLPSESTLMGRGVSACATCDGFFFQGKELIVVGGGDTAMEEALYLTKFATHVYVVHRRNKLRASKIMQKRAEEHPKISFIFDTIVSHIIGGNEGFVTGVELTNVVTQSICERQIDGVFIAIGHKPNTELFEGKLAMHDNGYLVTSHGTETSIAGVFACGDVQDWVYRQAVTAAGTGCMAAIDAERYLVKDS
jgi:thioredoxin reductase (NADPH)